jgi:hypothetical protein
MLTSKGRFVVVVSCFQSCLTYADKFLGVVAGGDSGFVNDRFGQTISIEWAFIRFSAVALFGGCRCFFDNRFVVCVYYPTHVVHAAVADFDVVPVEYLLEDMVFWEVFVDQMEKLFAYVGCHMFAEWWVVPNYIAFAFVV